MYIIRAYFIIFCLLLANSSYAQDSTFSKSAIKLGVGIGFNEGEREIGMGTLFSVGYQKSYWKNRLRINPNLLMGGFMPIAITDTRDQYYRISSLGVNAYVDAVRYRAISLFVGAGPHITYSRGLLGIGGDRDYQHERQDSKYFFKLYGTVSGSAGLRINPRKSRVAIELVPINVAVGSDFFVLGYMKLGVDIKLNKITQTE